MVKNKLFITIIFCLLFFMSFQNATGINLEKNKIKNEYFNKLDSTELPSSFSWTNINGVDYTTPVRNQRPYASCETFAYVAALEVMVQWEVGYPFGCDLSEAHLYFWSGGNKNWGSYPANDTDFLVNYGVPDEACWPYPNPTDPQIVFPKNTTAPNWRDRCVKIKNWSYLPPNNITAIKNAIVNNGPVPVHFHSYKDFAFYKKGVYTHKWGESRGLHLVCIMGYQDDPSIPSGGYWIVKNSWGTEYQNEGWFNIAYGECSIEEMPVLFEGVYGQFPILYVDDDNTAGPWNGTEEFPFQRINDGINAAYEGWTVSVKNGVYNENLIINKTINLDGESKENTIINGNSNGNVIKVVEPNVRISKFTIQNSGNKRLEAGIEIRSLDSNTTIENCILKENNVGIYLNCMDIETYTDSKSIIFNNIIIDNDIGIFATWTNNNQIINNTISDNKIHGIEMEASRNNIIQNNLISDHPEKGIYLHGASDLNQVISNTIKGNTHGIVIKESKQCKINKNNFVDNTFQASFLKTFYNNWRQNYWSDWNKRLPKTIKGTIRLGNLPWFNFDFLPSMEEF